MNLFAWGLIGLIQVCFLPGYLMCSITGVKGLLRTVIFSFGFSLIINFFIMFLAVPAGMASRNVYLAVFIVELAAITWLKRKSLLSSLSEGMGAFLSKCKDVSETMIRGIPNETSSIHRVAAITGLVLIAGSILLILYYAVLNTGTVFNTVDDVVSYNRWAVDWFQGILPKRTWTYPQLVTANWAMIYIFQGTSEVQLFAKVVMPFFTLFTVLVFVDIAQRARSVSFLWAGFILALFLNKVYGFLWITSGCMDLPVIFFITASLSMLILSRDENVCNDGARATNLTTGAIFAVGAALTKQPGVYFAVAYPALALFLVRDDLGKIKIKSVLLDAAKISILIGILCAPWYIYKLVQILMGAESHVLGGYVSLIDGLWGKTYLDKIIGSLLFLKRIFGIGSIIVIILLVIISLFKRPSRILNIFLLPWILAWMILLSYDQRNLSIALPIMGFILYYGLIESIDRGQTFLAWKTGFRISAVIQDFFKRIPWIAALALIIPVIIITMRYISNDSLVKVQLEQQKKIGTPELNRILYNYKSKNNIEGKVLTNYLFLYYLPDWKDFYQEEMFFDYNKFRELLSDEKIQYVLLTGIEHPLIDKRIISELDTTSASGENRFQVIAKGIEGKTSYIFIRIKRNETAR